MRKIDIALLALVLFLSFFGFFMIYDVSSYVSLKDFSDKYYYVRDQFFWVLIGFGGLIFLSLFDYKKLYNLSLPLLFTAIVLLVLVFVPGIGIQFQGANRWIGLGEFSLQPAEFVKLVLAIYLSAWFSGKEKGRLLAFLMLLGLVLFLVFMQPDMGTAIVILLEGLVIYFLSGGNIAYFAILLPLFFFLGAFLIKISPYRTERLEAFFKIGESVENSSYHLKQILIALGTGGILGVGLGNSTQKYAYLPETTTDSIFAVIAEELGFIGAIFVIALYVLIIWRGFRIAARVEDKFGKLLASGITTFLGVQAAINLGAVTVLFPLTGIPLPFISYGGSALIVDLCAVGILLNISRKS